MEVVRWNASDSVSRQAIGCSQNFHKTTTRRVRFGQDADALMVDYEPTPSLISERDIGICWWSRQEIRDMCFDAQRAVCMFRSGHIDSIDEFNRFFKICAMPTCNRGILKMDIESVHLLQSLQNSGCRGLEGLLYPIIPRYRNKHVKSLLIAQTRIPIGAAPEVRERLLCAISTRISRPSRILSRLLAHCDASQVADQAKLELRDYASCQE